MNGFIFGFHLLVWCPKWTPASNNSFTPILITVFLWLRALDLESHPAEHGIVYDVVMATYANPAWDIYGRFLANGGLTLQQSRNRGITI
jgi:hypothetical protein